MRSLTHTPQELKEQVQTAEANATDARTRLEEVEASAAAAAAAAAEQEAAAKPAAAASEAAVEALQSELESLRKVCTREEVWRSFECVCVCVCRPGAFLTHYAMLLLLLLQALNDAKAANQQAEGEAGQERARLEAALVC